MATPGADAAARLSGSSSARPPAPGNRSTAPAAATSAHGPSTMTGFGREQMRTNANMDTLDEPVWDTFMRDFRNLWHKTRRVIVPYGDSNVLRDWDLWGPMILCLVLSVRLSVTAQESQKTGVFTSVFAIVCLGSVVVSINSKLLGGRISFFQSVCVLGYCIFPLVAASLVSLFVPSVLVRLIVTPIAFAWSTYASNNFLADTNLNRRKILAVYPIFLFYAVIAWMILISRSLLD
ncbi:hypothetical protein CXG81DRAFT_11955 [Caulochytrium protostelioides]|uniref:Protein YIP n=1 Tax=Caulochytrium protostelioides TaxID=1555241 RepID=A0A4P9X877_9FUNG|nr:hypothetical protein CXG81DRAFT_11955 [Caulochytrium protostelioides]|eukprot:RKP01473.1 hypothetical protein CXG81DRAFT_11955 [Caulochytrium protostelioides]